MLSGVVSTVSCGGVGSRISIRAGSQSRLGSLAGRVCGKEAPTAGRARAGASRARDTCTLITSSEECNCNSEMKIRV